MIVFSPGDGEQVGLDVTLANKNSLPRMIAAGMTPYSLVGKDTLYWLVITIHNNAGSSYRTQLVQILPWLWDKAGFIYDPKRVWMSGLSGGGSATWASVMVDTSLSRRITGIAPLANGGYDDFLTKLQSNLIYACKVGVNFWPYIGDQDPGYNGPGFFAYDAVVKSYALKDHYHPHIIKGGQHNASVWDVPFNNRSFWDSLGLIGYTAPIPAVPKVKAYVKVDSAIIHYPTTWVNISDSSINSIGGTWDILEGPNRPIITGKGAGLATYSGLIPGVYRIGIHVYGDGNTPSNMSNADSAAVLVTVYGPPACPPQRSVSGVQFAINNGVFSWIVTYSDGSSEIKQP